MRKPIFNFRSIFLGGGLWALTYHLGYDTPCLSAFEEHPPSYYVEPYPHEESLPDFYVEPVAYPCEHGKKRSTHHHHLFPPRRHHHHAAAHSHDEMPQGKFYYHSEPAPEDGSFQHSSHTYINEFDQQTVSVAPSRTIPVETITQWEPNQPSDQPSYSNDTEASSLSNDPDPYFYEEPTQQTTSYTQPAYSHDDTVTQWEPVYSYEEPIQQTAPLTSYTATPVETITQWEPSSTTSATSYSHDTEANTFPDYASHYSIEEYVQKTNPYSPEEPIQQTAPSTSYTTTPVETITQWEPSSTTSTAAYPHYSDEQSSYYPPQPDHSPSIESWQQAVPLSQPTYVPHDTHTQTTTHATSSIPSDNNSIPYYSPSSLISIKEPESQPNTSSASSTSIAPIKNEQAQLEQPKIEAKATPTVSSAKVEPSTDPFPEPVEAKKSLKSFYKNSDLVSQVVKESPRATTIYSSDDATSNSTTLNSHSTYTPPSLKTLPKEKSEIAQVDQTDATRVAPLLPPPSTTRIIPGPTAAPINLNEPDAPTGYNQSIKEISVNFNNVSMIEYIRFISRITGRNFLFDEADLQFNVTIISEEPTSLENLTSALLQELKIRNLSLIEQGNNLIIHRNPRVRAPGNIVADGIPTTPSDTEIVTRVFRLNTLDPFKASDIIKPLLSDDALVEVLRDSNNLIITDLSTNVNRIAQLITTLDAPNGGMTIGQYVVRNAFVDSLAILGERILQPIAQGNPFVFVAHPASNSIFIVSNPFLVEKALGILENLDINEGRTKIFSLEKLRFREDAQSIQDAAAEDARRALQERRPPQEGGPQAGAVPPPGPPALGDRDFVPGIISSAPRWMEDLPVGHIQRTLFFIHKLKYRRGDQIEIALRKIANSLQLAGMTNAELISAIDSIQWIEATNSLIFTGTASSLERIQELVDEIDLPLRQVFIEVLILDATITDSLRYGVEWGTRFGGGNTAGSQAFLGSDTSALARGLDTAENVRINPNDIVTGPNARGLARTEGFSLGIIGRHLTRDGTLFNSIAALVTAVHLDAKTNIVLNPKIITEDNHTAEIFVGSTTRYKTQSISNDQGNVITNNFQFLDVGTTFRVTPLIGSNDVITLDIVQETTNETPTANATSANTSQVDVNLVPVLSKNRTLTKVHVPNGFFVVLSGMIQDNQARTLERVPCLGGIPLIGAANKQQAARDDKRNLMLFIRPLIIDTDDELEYLTKRQQDVYREKEKFPRRWNREIDEALDFFNIRPVDPDEIGCTIK